jgi:lysyl-tRNA synthetase class II
MVQHKEINKCNSAYKQKQRQKSHDILINAEKVLDKIQHAFMIKVLKKLGRERAFLNIIYDQPLVNIILIGDQMKPFLLKLGKTQGPSLSPLPSNIFLEFIARAVRQEQEIKECK